MTTTINLVIAAAADPDNRARLSKLNTGTCYENKDGFWVKQEAGYSLALGSLRRYPVDPEERVDNVFSRITITVH